MGMAEDLLELRPDRSGQLGGQVVAEAIDDRPGRVAKAECSGGEDAVAARNRPNGKMAKRKR